MYSRIKISQSKQPISSSAVAMKKLPTMIYRIILFLSVASNCNSYEEKYFVDRGAEGVRNSGLIELNRRSSDLFGRSPIDIPTNYPRTEGFYGDMQSISNTEINGQVSSMVTKPSGRKQKKEKENDKKAKKDKKKAKTKENKQKKKAKEKDNKNKKKKDTNKRKNNDVSPTNSPTPISSSYLNNIPSISPTSDDVGKYYHDDNAKTITNPPGTYQPTSSPSESLSLSSSKKDSFMPNTSSDIDDYDDDDDYDDSIGDDTKFFPKNPYFKDDDDYYVEDETMRPTLFPVATISSSPSLTLSSTPTATGSGKTTNANTSVMDGDADDNDNADDKNDIDADDGGADGPFDRNDIDDVDEDDTFDKNDIDDNDGYDDDYDDDDETKFFPKDPNFKDDDNDVDDDNWDDRDDSDDDHDYDGGTSDDDQDYDGGTSDDVGTNNGLNPTPSPYHVVIMFPTSSPTNAPIKEPSYAPTEYPQMSFTNFPSLPPKRTSTYAPILSSENMSAKWPVPSFSLFLNFSTYVDADEIDVTIDNILLNITTEHLKFMYSNNFYFDRLTLTAIKEKRRELSVITDDIERGNYDLSFAFTGTSWFFAKYVDIYHLTAEAFRGTNLIKFTESVLNSRIGVTGIYVELSWPHTDNSLKNIGTTSMETPQAHIGRIAVIASTACILTMLVGVMIYRSHGHIDPNYTECDTDGSANLEFQVVEPSSLDSSAGFTESIENAASLRYSSYSSSQDENNADRGKNTFSRNHTEQDTVVSGDLLGLGDRPVEETYPLTVDNLGKNNLGNNFISRRNEDISNLLNNSDTAHYGTSQEARNSFYDRRIISSTAIPSASWYSGDPVYNHFGIEMPLGNNRFEHHNYPGQAQNIKEGRRNDNRDSLVDYENFTKERRNSDSMHEDKGNGSNGSSVGTESDGGMFL